MKIMLIQSILGSSLVVQRACNATFRPDIRADSNRDGVVDMKGNSDNGNKAAWTPQSGAIFLPNIGDKHLRCTTKDKVDNP
jgi:protein-arginine deiminase